MNAKVIFFVALVFSFGPASQAQERPSQPFLYSGGTMGTSYHIKFFGHPPPKLQSEVDTLLVELNRQMSTYEKDSEISQFNGSPAHTPFVVSQDFFEVAVLASEVFRTTDGAFDPTLGLVVNLWGFGPQGRQQKIPDAEILENSLKIIGYNKFVLDSEKSSITKPHHEVKLDLSAIAKGFGVDKVAAYLESLGILDYMVEIGGEVRTKGQKTGGHPWVIGIEMPIDRGVTAGVVPVSPGDHGMATSGDYRNYFEHEGQRMSHIIDPRTGHPISHNLASVTVLAASCAEADAMATAMMVMGADAALKLAETKGIPAYFILRTGEVYTQKMSSFMGPFIKKEK